MPDPYDQLRAVLREKHGLGERANIMNKRTWAADGSFLSGSAVQRLGAEREEE
jgi:hypothetical protein